MRALNVPGHRWVQAGITSAAGLSPAGNDSAPSPASRTPPVNKFEGIPQEQSSTTSCTKSTLGPRVLPKLPQKVALRKIDTIHHPSVDRPSQPLEVFHKVHQVPEAPQKSPLPEKPLLSDLPPKPQISDLPPKPQLAELPPKPQIKDLPPKPQVVDTSARAPPSDGGQRPPLIDPSPKPHSSDGPASSQHGELLPKQHSEDTNGTTSSVPEMPIPLPRKINVAKTKARRVKTIYDCQADNEDELTFTEGEVIVVTGEEDQEWWIGHIEGQPERKGVFPMSFVHILSD